jgi:transcriptional regulator with PAS, ATPase and Fis domain
VAQRVVHLEKKVAVTRLKIRSALSAKYSLSDIRGQSAAIAQARELAEQYAKTDSPVLIVGPTGTGKELFAHSIHQESDRAEGPFVSINCAALPADLSESELFGYAPGAFTGARKEGKIGYIELADKGTLFLDEIGDMPAMLQVKLLRVLEEKVVYRLGETDPHPVDFRLVAATNKALKEQIRVRKFREDLYYRLSTMTIVVPPLRERTEDLPILVRHMLERLGRPLVKCSNAAMDAIIGFDWPGNVRQLKNVMERALSTCKDDVIEHSDLPPDLAGAQAAGPAPRGERERVPLSQFRSENEKSLILDTLAEHNWNVVRSARALNISRATLYEKLKKHQISRHDAPVAAH